MNVPVNPLHQPENSPPTKARVLIETSRGPRPSALRLQTAVLAAFLVGLVALATWGFLARREAEQSPEGDALPKDAVALINSSTPIAGRNSPLTLKDTVDEVAYAPESEGWSQAIRDAHQAQEEGRYSSAISLYSALVGG